MEKRDEASWTADLGSLENDYQMLGELRGTASARYYIGRARQNGAAEVGIMVVRAPKGDDTNALSHFASDVKLLAGRPHPTIPQVLDGRWIGNAFAVVSERVVGETLGELLERGEKFTNPRTAMLLQEVSGVLD